MEFIKRYRKILAVVVIGIWSFPAYSYAATDKDREITLVVPERVLQEFINEVLPVELIDHDKVSGILWIQSIEDLRLGLNKVWFTATIHGENIAYKGSVGGIPANLRFGALDSTLHCEATIRYDAEKQLLSVRPKIVEEGKKGDVLRILLIALFSEREYPVEIQKFRPIATQFSDKTVEIDMDISCIYTANGRLLIAMRPTVKAKQMDTAK
jgi:hypothetical protein